MADYTFTATNVAWVSGSRVTTKVAAETLTAGQIIYINADGAVAKADANASGKKDVAGIALNACGAGQPAVYQTSGEISFGSGTFTTADIVIPSATAGGLCPSSDLTTGMQPGVVGFAQNSGTLTLVLSNGTGITR